MKNKTCFLRLDNRLGKEGRLILLQLFCGVFYELEIF